jgi:hypothetical protein
MPLGSQGYGSYVWDQNTNDWTLNTPAYQAKKQQEQNASAISAANLQAAQFNVSGLARKNEQEQYDFDVWKKGLPKTRFEQLDFDRRLKESQSRTQRDLDRQNQMRDIEYSTWNPAVYSQQLQKQKAYENAQIDFNMKQLQFRNEAMDWKKQMMQRFGFGRSTSSGGGMGYSQQTPSYGSPSYGSSPFPWKETSASRSANMNQSWTNYSSPQFPTK